MTTPEGPGSPADGPPAWGRPPAGGWGDPSGGRGDGRADPAAADPAAADPAAGDAPTGAPRPAPGARRRPSTTPSGPPRPPPGRSSRRRAAGGTPGPPPRAGPRRRPTGGGHPPPRRCGPRGGRRPAVPATRRCPSPGTTPPAAPGPRSWSWAPWWRCSPSARSWRSSRRGALRSTVCSTRRPAAACAGSARGLLPLDEPGRGRRCGARRADRGAVDAAFTAPPPSTGRRSLVPVGSPPPTAPTRSTDAR
jgi:hypothetical protein